MTNLRSISLGARLITERQRIDRAQGALTLLEAQRAGLERRVLQAQSEIETWRRVQLLLANVSEYARTQVVARIQTITTSFLRAVFNDDSLEFRVTMKTLNNMPAAEWEVASGVGADAVSAAPEDSRGGGIVDVVSIGLRLGLMELLGAGGPLVLDEPGKMVSREYIGNLAYALQRYARDTGRQIVMVTHANELAEVADTTWRVSKRPDGVSEVRAG